MSVTQQQEEQTIAVMSKEGNYLSHCTLKRARQLIRRNSAFWRASDMIQLKHSDEDKRRFKRIALERDKYTCYLCGLVMHPKHPLLTVDHDIPRIRGGSDEDSNLRCACSKCNQEKRSTHLDEYLNQKGE